MSQEIGALPQARARVRLTEPDKVLAASLAFEYLETAPILSHQPLPLAAECVSCGFPSPAENYILKELDLNELCVRDPPATFFLRATGTSMIEDRIYPDDILVVEKGRDPVSGDRIIGVLDGKFTCKRLEIDRNGSMRLIPANRSMHPIELHDGQELFVWGIVRWVFHRF